MNQLPSVQESQARPPGDQDHNTQRELSLRGAGDTGDGSSANQRTAWPSNWPIRGLVPDKNADRSPVSERCSGCSAVPDPEQTHLQIIIAFSSYIGASDLISMQTKKMMTRNYLLGKVEA